MRTRNRAAYGAALLYVLSAAPVWACPVAADLDGAGIRFVGADGSDEVHRRAEPDMVAIDYVTLGTLGGNRSVLVHGIYLHSFSDVDGSGAVVDGSLGVFTRPGKVTDLPLPVSGLTWSGGHSFTDATDTFTEAVSITVGAPTTWTLGACSYTALPVLAITSDGTQEIYRETMTYLPDLGTAVLVRFSDSSGPSTYDYVDIGVDG